MTDHSETHAIFTVERLIDLPLSIVFAGFSDPQTKRRWMGGEEQGWTVDRFEMDFRVGGVETWRFSFGDSGPMSNDVVFLDIVEDRRIVIAYAMIIAGKRISASLATTTFVSEGSGTRVTYTEQATFLDGADTPESREAGCRELLAALETDLTGSRKVA